MTAFERMRKLCVGLDVYSAKNRIQKLFPQYIGKVQIKFEESDIRRFTVIDCKLDKESDEVTLIATSKNPIRYLPSYYQENDFLRHFLMIFQHIMNETTIELDNINNLFCPMKMDSRYLSIIAAWLGIDFDLLGSEDVIRKYMQYAIPLYKYRGTKTGIQALMKIMTGVTPEIIEGALPFKAMLISNQTDVGSNIMDKYDTDSVFSVYFPVEKNKFKSDLIRRISKILQKEKSVHTKCFLYFKPPVPKKRKAMVISKDTQVMGVDGLEI